MTTPSVSRISRLALAGALAMVAAGGCDNAQEPGSEPGDVLAALIVSNPTSAAATAVAGLALSGAAADEVVYASLPPGSVPDGEQAVITPRRTGVAVTVAMVAGGFDPIAVPAGAGDTLDVRITLAGGGGMLGFVAVVPERRPPVVVRTDPPPKKRDVPLNAVLLVVFSEPIDAATVTDSSVRLLLSGTPVAGTLAFADDGHVTVMFAPAVLLDPGADYTLLVTQAIADLNGDALEAPATVTFRTEDAGGTIWVSAATTGVDADGDGYLVMVDGGPKAAGLVGPNDSLVLTGVPAGGHEVRLVGVATNCAVDGGAERQVSVVAGQFVTVSFAVACVARVGSIVVSVATTGTDLQTSEYRLDLDGNAASSIGLNDTVTLAAVREGSHMVWLRDVAANCAVAGPNPQTFALAFGETVTAAFAVACVPVTPLAFVRDGQIYLVNSNGTGLVRLSDGPDDGGPAWSPDGQRIAFTRARGDTSDVYVMNADGSNLVRRTTSGRVYDAPSWSPDGQWIAFAALNPLASGTRGQGSSDVYVMSVDDDGTSPINLTDERGWESYPAWSPDGTRIAFVADWTAYDFTLDIYVMTPTGPPWAQLTDGFGFGGSLVEYHQPAWSPDGQRFAVVTCLIAYVTCGASTVAVMTADGSGLVPLVATSGFARPTWSPDGRTIAFGSSGSIQWIAADGSTQGVIVADGHSPAWRP